MADKQKPPIALNFETGEEAIAYARSIAAQLSFDPAYSGEAHLFVRNEHDETVAIIPISRPPG